MQMKNIILSMMIALVSVANAGTPSINKSAAILTTKPIQPYLFTDRNGNMTESTDGGKTWMKYSVKQPNTVSRNIAFIGKSGIAETSTDGGMTWQKGESHSVSSLFINKDDAETEKSDDIAKNVSSANDKMPVSLQLFPNPVNNELVIKYDIQDVNQTKISIYNMLMEKVYDFPGNDSRVGENTIRLNTTNYSSGIYFVAMQTNNSFVKNKFFVIK
jgi:hypothetical protein